MRSVVSVTVAVGLAIPAAGAEPTKETLPYFGHLANVKENSALSMDCDGDPLGTIHCSFTQVTVSVSDRDTAELEKKRAEVLSAPPPKLSVTERAGPDETCAPEAMRPKRNPKSGRRSGACISTSSRRLAPAKTMVVLTGKWSKRSST